MRDIQFIGGNNTLLTEKIVKSCIKSCEPGCDEERLITMSIPANSILLELSTIGMDLEEDFVAPITIGIEDNGTEIHKEEVTVVSGTLTTTDLPNVNTGAEAIVFTVTPATYPTKGSVCFMVKYLDLKAQGVVNAVIPDLCNTECGCD